MKYRDYLKYLGLGYARGLVLVRVLVLLLVFLQPCLRVGAQDSGTQRSLAKAEEEFKKYAFIDARAIYLEVARGGYASQDLYEKLGDSYYFNGELEAAREWYGKLVEGYPDTSGEYYFRYAQGLKASGDYDKADQVMARFSDKVERDDRAELFEEEPNYLELIEMQSGRFELRSLGINSVASDFAPSFYQGEVVFSSSRGGQASKILHEWNEMPFLDLYTVARSGGENSSDLQGLQKLKGKVNSRFHESSTAFSPDGNTMYFTRNNYTKKQLKRNQSGTILLKLYRAKRKNGKWGEVEELPFNSDEYSTAHPALSRDGKTLYFASDRPGGEGLSDLYRTAIKEDGSFGEIESLGKNINTAGRDTFPFVSSSGRLYFASDGHPGLGGLDVFIALEQETGDERQETGQTTQTTEDTKEMGLYQDPINVGEPVNSPEDDFSFILNEDTRIGFFSSNREGGVGSDDLYSFLQLEDLILTCRQYLEGKVSDKETGRILPDARVELLDKDSKVISEAEVDGGGVYRFEGIDCNKDYRVRASRQGYRTEEVAFESDKTFEKRYTLPIALTPGEELTGGSAGLGDDIGKLLQLQPIYFDLDKNTIREDAEVELQKVIAAMRQYPTLKIEIRSHTDSRASDAYNKSLSERRARATVEYIITKGGIDKARITGEGYGETQLVNRCANGVPCSKEDHQKNRRSEFIVVE